MTTSAVVADRLNIQVILPLLSEADPGVQERDTSGVVDVLDVVDVPDDEEPPLQPDRTSAATNASTDNKIVE